MNAEDLIKVCKNYGIDVLKCYGGIKFKDIPGTKKYFNRRPVYKIFEFKGKIPKEGPLQYDEYYVGYGYNKVKAPIIFFKPRPIEEISTWQVEEFLEKGRTPVTYFRNWYRDREAIYTVEDFEKAIQTLFNSLEILDKVMKSNGLKKLENTYKEQKEKIKEAETQLEDIKKKYKQSLLKECKLEEDF